MKPETREKLYKIFDYLNSAAMSRIVGPTPAPLFRYQGNIYVRPVGRGVVMLDDPYRERYFDDEVLHDGYYHAEIIIRPATEPAHCVDPDSHRSMRDHINQCWR